MVLIALILFVVPGVLFLKEGFMKIKKNGYESVEASVIITDIIVTIVVCLTMVLTILDFNLIVFHY